MGMFDPIAPNTLFRAHLPSTLGYTNLVKVVPNGADDMHRTWTISWTPRTGAVRYIVYASPSPVNLSKYADVPPSQTSIEFTIPVIVPDDYMFYFNVAMERPNGSEVFLQDQPVYTSIDSAFEVNPLSYGTERDIIYDPDDKWRIESIRRRNLAMLEYDGEDFHLFIKRVFGQPCVCLTETVGNEGQRITPLATQEYTELDSDFDPTQPTEHEKIEAKDPEYQSAYRCKNCFGTGIAGGYFPKIKIRARYGNIPRRSFKFEEQGVEFMHNFNSWTIWHPRMKEGDFLYRIRTGERFLVTDVGQSELRGIPMHQEFNCITAPRTAMIYDVKDETIVSAIQAENAWDVANWDWSIWQ